MVMRMRATIPGSSGKATVILAKGARARTDEHG
jgi:hypothetical protein